MKPRGIFGTREQIEAEMEEFCKQYPLALAVMRSYGDIESKPYFEIHIDPGPGGMDYNMSRATTWLRTAYKNLGFLIGKGVAQMSKPELVGEQR